MSGPTIAGSSLHLTHSTSTVWSHATYVYTQSPFCICALAVQRKPRNRYSEYLIQCTEYVLLVWQTGHEAHPSLSIQSLLQPSFQYNAYTHITYPIKLQVPVEGSSQLIGAMYNVLSTCTQYLVFSNLPKYWM
jgi:hypothetical protein